jgi:hypothetical protein
MNASKLWLSVAILVVLVGGITFVSQFVASGSSKTQVGDPPPPPDPLLAFYQPEYEAIYSEPAPARGYFDFLFRNQKDEPVELGLEGKSCKCQGVDALILTSQQVPAYLRAAQAGSVAQVLAAPGQACSVLAMGGALQQRMNDIVAPAKWQEMLKNETTLTVPPQGGGLVRMRWEGKQPGNQRMKVAVWAQPPGKEQMRAFASLELPVAFVLPVLVTPLTADVREITLGSLRTVSFVCYSNTRMAFSLQANEKDNDPCFECQCKPIGAAEIESMREGQVAAGEPLLAGYLVSVTVREHHQGKKLDVGSFMRKIVLNSDSLIDPVELPITGSVAGDVRMVGEPKLAAVLGTFDADSGGRIEVFLESDRPDMKMELESHTPSYLDVKLEEAGSSPSGGKQWKLFVQVPRNRLAGRLKDSAIVLKTKDSPPRRVRIPVYGHAVIK